MTSPRRIVLTGFMASGKTTIGRCLGDLIGVPAIDLDAKIAQTEECEIATLISAKGESWFRTCETSCLEQTLDESQECVISLGGGAWMNERNRELLSEFSFLSVWIDTPLELCWQRINLEMGDSVRPLVPNYFVARDLYLGRREAYSLAEIRIVPSAFDPPAKLAAEIRTRIEGHGIL